MNDEARLTINSPTRFAREYVRLNLFNKRRNQIIEDLLHMTTLKQSSIETIYTEEQNTVNMEIVNKRREERKYKIPKYKGKERDFFKFDDSCLYKGLI